MSTPDRGLTLAGIASGGKRALAAALSRIERESGGADVLGLLDEAHAAPRAHVIGITGPPGVGKSSLASALVERWRRGGATVAVIAVDPSSRSSGGALLADRVRLRGDPADRGLFFRSLAARGRLGGLADLAFPSVVLVRALFDRVIVESVGVGQSEAEITSVADTVLLCVQPGSGDSLQFMKAGVMEIPHVALVTKADVGAAARRAEAELRAALSLASNGEPVVVLSASAESGEGLEALEAALAARWSAIGGKGRLEAARRRQAEEWLADLVRSEFGRRGEAAAGPALALEPGRSPFGYGAALLGRLEVSLAPP